MGQTSLPSLNRAGVFSFWSGMWDSKFQYPMYLTKFEYVDLFFLNFFKNQIFLFLFLNLKKKLKTNVYFFKNFLVKGSELTIKKDIKKYYFCTSKVWLIKYSGWIIISVYIYDTGFKKSKKKRSFNKNLKNLKNKTFIKYKLLKFKNFLKKGRKNKKVIIKKTLKRLRKFFNMKWGGFSMKNTTNKISKSRIFSEFSKNVFLRKWLKRRIFKKTFLNTKVLKFFKKKESLLKNNNSMYTTVNNYKYNML